MRVAFGEFVLDLASRELRRGDEPVHLSPKAFQLLEVLVRGRPAALSKSELLAKLWPDTFVVEANLANLAGELRQVLGDDPRKPRFVRTIQRFGYAFRGDAPAARPRSSAGRAVWRLDWRGGHAELPNGEHVLGRDLDLELRFDSSSVSRRHARIRVSEDEAVLEDLDSKNGTFVAERRVSSPVRLADGDEIRLGVVRLAFHRVRRAESTRTTPSSTST
jgi:DNA-binding winged helix-turn-helix (wHTH) protein